MGNRNSKSKPNLDLVYFYYKTNIGFEQINKILRSALSFNSLPEKQKEHIEIIDSILTSGNPLELYTVFDSLDSSITTHQGYSICSENIDTVASTFTDDSCCIVKFVLPPNIKRFIFKKSPWSESEVLLERNLQFQIFNKNEVYKGISVYNAIVSKFTLSDIQKSINYYKTDEGYIKINQSLRRPLLFDDLDEEVKRNIFNIDNAMTTGESLVLYRGFHNLDSYFEGDKSSVIIDEAYSSSSKDIEVAASFTLGEPCCIIKFVLPENIKRFDYQDPDYESEVLLERNLQFQILDDFEEYKGIRVHLAIISKYVPSQIDPKVLEKTRELMGINKNLPYIKTMKIIDELKSDDRLKDIMIYWQDELDQAKGASNYKKIDFINKMFKETVKVLKEISKYDRPNDHRVYNIFLNILYNTLSKNQELTDITNEMMKILMYIDMKLVSESIFGDLYPNQKETIAKLNSINLQKIVDFYGIDTGDFKSDPFALKLLIIDHRNSINDTSDIKKLSKQL